MIEGLDSREAAAALLSGVLEKRQPLDQAAAQHREFAAFSPQDKAFTQRMVKTTLRRLGQIDAMLDAWIEKPLAEKFAPVKHILRIGVTQLLWTEVPPHAAVHLAVEAARRAGFQHQSGLVNAVLKRASTEGRRMAETQDAARLNTPAWLWENWVEAYGQPAARRIAESHLEEPPLDISVKSNAAIWAEKLGGELLPGGSVRLMAAPDIASLPGYAEGAWWVQDAAAAMPVKMLAEALGSLKGKYVVDLCAAPGGKTAQLAAAGARVTAVDITENRMKTLRENFARLQLQAEVMVADALKWQPATPPDAILLDAPCSATGTIRRHPDVAHLRKLGDITRLCATQGRLLRHALALLPPGGLLAYAVCSLQPEEGIKQINQLLEEHKNVRLLARSLPCSEEAGDGFYIGIMEKQA